jgi:hypothetical protein
MSRLAVKRLLMMGCALGLPLTAFAADGPSVRIEVPQLQGSRVLEKQTETAVIRDYIQSWKSFSAALDRNQASLLDQDFVGTAHDKLAATIDDQAKAGIHTRYEDRSHDLQIVFYSPEGLSIQLTDTVEYDEQVYDHEKLMASKPAHVRYVVIMTPSEVRWKVRVFQASASE